MADRGASAAMLTALAAKIDGFFIDWYGVRSDEEKGFPALLDLAERASGIMADLGIDTVAVVDGELGQGFARQAPYDVIVINGAVAEIPAAISEQLAEGGRMVIVERQGLSSRANLYLNKGGVTSRRELFDAMIPVLPGFEAAETFRF